MFTTRPSVIIDSYRGGPFRYNAEHGYVAVASDVIRATTTAITALANGRRCYPVNCVEDAFALGAQLREPLLAAEQGGDMPDGFHLTNSPAQVAERPDIHRPMVLLSSSGTKLLCAARQAQAAYAVCLRNISATARHLTAHHSHQRIALLGAESLNEFREEDQLCCAWLAAALLDAGFEAEDQRTLDLVERWRDAPTSAILVSNSAQYLLRSNQEQDLDFVLHHVDDVDAVYAMHGSELQPVAIQHQTRTAEPSLALAA